MNYEFSSIAHYATYPFPIGFANDAILIDAGTDFALIGYARISKADGSQSLDLQRDALREAGVSDDAIYEDQTSGQREDRPGLAAPG